MIWDVNNSIKVCIKMDYDTHVKIQILYQHGSMVIDYSLFFYEVLKNNIS